MSDTEIEVPRNREAEQAVLGACIQSNHAFDDARRFVTAEDFWHPAHQKIWAMIEAIMATGETLHPMTVMQELKKAGVLADVGGAPYLGELIVNPWSDVNVSYHSRIVAEAAQARRALQIHQRMGQALMDHSADHDQLLGALARQLIDLEVLVDEKVGLAPIPGLSSWDAFLDKPREGVRWIVPSLLMRQDVMILLAGEGGGKSWFTRQFCMCIAAGMNPFRPERSIAPRNSLHIDLENPEDLVAEESRGLRSQVRQLGAWRPDNAHIWHKPSGLNLRDHKDAMLLERAIVDSEAEVVSLGSLYKAFSRRGDSWDQAAEETREVFDRLRERYGCAFILEAHMPKGGGGPSYERPQTPFGSQQWIGWASLGRIINRVGDNMYRFDDFRGDRGVREFPVALTRGGELPWSPVWDTVELEYGMWEELRSAKKKRSS